MKTQILQQVQKAQRLANKLIISLILLLYSNNASSQGKSDDTYYLANKIIQMTCKKKDSFYNLNKNIQGNKYLLKKYYNLKFQDKPFYTIMAYDSINDRVGYDTLNLEKNILKWKKQYRLMDSVFSKSDIQRFIDKKMIANQWDVSNTIFNKNEVIIKWCKNYCENSISYPYYNDKKNYALIVYSTTGMSTTFYIFRKEENDWLLVDKIDDVGW